MNYVTTRRTILLIAQLAIAFLAFSQDQVTSKTFDPAAYKATQEAILSKVNVPGAYPGAIALQFADTYNATVHAHPGSVTEIDAITNDLAKTYDVGFKMESGIMKTAQFEHVNFTPNNQSTSSPVPDTKSNIDVPPKEIFKVVEQMPRFPGCEDPEGTNEEKYQCAYQKFLDYVYSNLKYPEEARAQHLQGRVVIQFVVEIDGSITDIEAVRDIGGDVETRLCA